ncbi:hypothetical protein [Vibrio coralliirubri]|uniref:hypothetical protein n=1 Tax=Vibrio coralliirubri TaxID=1516159 RepID=UPI0006316071|nr:hypothetical protein [Vibrio coralliirubri]CDS97751.1 hypothetical protein VCR6J2_190049 [Vibrio coralliirubri]CDS99949.1 hypothetical protein VCR1J2_190258 [Vibrio coralliirubri]CDT50147.1 hypothetical protein VCR26J2_170271 [Vibrio coralliirubri]CDU09218.1 hypothetical protein VCR8J2_50274 [Vibrio coralliirubri]
MLRRKLIATTPYLIKIEPTTISFDTCGSGHWLALKCGGICYQARLIPPQYVKPYVKGNKNDFIESKIVISRREPRLCRGAVLYHRQAFKAV